VEVWLDSIATGTKIADCKIEPTGNWTSFKRFTAKISAVKGNHDVYLNFVGAEGTTKLFQLKWMNFIKKNTSTSTTSRIEKSVELSIYPNPAKDWLSIYSGFQFSKVEIFNMNGQSVYQDKRKSTQSSVVNFNLDRGMYILKVSNDANSASCKFTIDSK
jgi:hypothetical protein